MRCANASVIRERHPIPTVDEVLQNLNQSSVYSKLDLKWGYHQIELEEESRNITVFTTHKGLYRYKRLMFGISAAPELYQYIMQQVLQGCDGAENISDDIIIHGADQNEHDRRLIAVLEKLHRKGLTLNKEKCKFRMNKLEFMGHDLSEKGIGPTEAKVEAVRNAREPRSATEVRSFLGLVNFSARYIPDMATVSEPLRMLTKTNVPFKWEREQQHAFDTLKEKLTNAQTLAYFDVKAQTRVIADASPVGLGAILAQKQSNGSYRAVCYASKSLSDVEKRYSQTEKEALALVWACERFQLYLLGNSKFELITDHKPLEVIYSRQSRPSARIERWVLRLQPYDFVVKYRPGKEMAADALSRLTQNGETSSTSDAEEYIRFVSVNAVPRALTIQEIEQASAEDETFNFVRQSIQSQDWSSKEVKQYSFVQNELTSLGQLILRGPRLVIPAKLRKTVTQLAHEGHQGIVRTKQRLRTKVWWPGLEKDAEKLCKKCHACQVVSQPSTQEPMTRTEFPNAPWEHLAIDIMGPFPSGDSLLVTVDYYSRFYDVCIMKTMTSATVIERLDQLFAVHGYPLTVKCDNGPQFASDEMGRYLEDCGIERHLVTPLWPVANGEVERQNKSLLKAVQAFQVENKNWKKELHTYLLAYRSTPHPATGKSPAEMLFGRMIRSKLPELSSFKKDDLAERDRDSEKKQQEKFYGDKRRNAQPSNLKVGDKVLLKQKKKDKLTPTFESTPYTVMAKYGNQLTIRSEAGVIYKRNTSHVKKYHENDIESNTDSADEDQPVGVEAQDNDNMMVKINQWQSKSETMTILSHWCDQVFRHTMVMQIKGHKGSKNYLKNSHKDFDMTT